MSRFRTALIGAGFISSSHAEALRAGVADTELTAIVDQNLALAEAQAKRWKIPHVYANVEALIEAAVADVAHVLVPPDAHAVVARRLLEGGAHVFLEKPMATSVGDGEALTAIATTNDRVLGVNQNFVFHPAYRAAKKILIDQCRLGPIRSLQVSFNVPLRQLAARQFGHWMLRQPLNILLEQAVHPLSQMVDLLGVPTRVQCRTGSPLLLAPNKSFYDRWNADFSFGETGAQLNLAFGQSFHAWRMTAICDDGVLVCDMSANRLIVQGRTQWPDFLDNFVGGTRIAGGVFAQSAAGTFNYVAALLKLRPSSDGFSVSMRDSIGAFYRGLPSGRAPLDGAFGTSLVRICESLAAAVPSDAKPQIRTVAPAISGRASPDLVVFGGTGFIGGQLVGCLIAEGRSVRVVARGADRAQPPFDSPLVEIMRGDVAKRDDVERAMAGARQVVNLAHGGGGTNWPDIQRTMVASALLVAECAAAARVERLVHVGSIAGLYLGDRKETVTGATPPDPEAERRSLYARGKAEADRLLLEFAAKNGLGLVILRPGLVVGAGTSALHGGLGFFNNEQHVIGWNGGTNPLPFVLVDDVADAIIAALGSTAALGKSYNLVGDVRPTAREFVKMLAEATRRPLAFHPQAVDWLYAAELFKWGIKRATGKTVDLPSRRDLRSRGLSAMFDCSDAKRDLGWQPVGDRAIFAAKAIAVHQKPFERAISAGTQDARAVQSSPPMREGKASA